MSVTSRYANTGVVRQLLRASSSSPAVITTAIHTTNNSTATICSNWHQSRSYAVSKGPRAPLRKPPKAPVRAPRVPSQSQSKPRPSLDFDALKKVNQILTPDVFEKVIQQWDGILKAPTTEECYKHAMNYLQHILDNAPNLPNLAAVGISVETAHVMGCLTFLENAPEIQNLGCSLLARASAANYNPSTITMARFLFRSGEWGMLRSAKHIENRFMKLVYEGKDCNALAVYGEHLFRTRKYAAAVPMLNQAISVDDGIFEWKNMCMLCLAKAHAQLGKIKEAEDVLEMLGDPDAWIELGPLLDRGGFEDKRQWLYREGFTGNLEEFRKLAEMDFEKASKETDKALKHEYNLWAMEWSRLADPSVN
ncbi:hypothetical protein FSST1_002305 [Fusarium sambucinum]